MSALWMLGVCLMLGALIGRFARPPSGLAAALNWWVLNIALPALVLELIAKLHFDWHLWFLVASQWSVFAGAWILFHLLGRHFNWSRGRIGALVLTCGLGNTSFMGYPMIEALRGNDALALAVVADQLGCFVALAVGGIIVAALYSGQRPQPRQIARRVLLFPAFIALAVGVVVGLLGGWPAIPDSMLGRLGQTLTPLALFSVGLQFRLHLGRSQLGALSAGLGWKLMLAPMLVYGTGIAASIPAPVLTVGVLQAAMAPMISAAILAEQHELEPPLANTILGAGIVLSLASVPLISWLLG